MTETRRGDEGGITDEGIARLRARIGVPEPHTQPPRYREATSDAFRHAGGVMHIGEVFAEGDFHGAVRNEAGVCW